ncbi:MAG: TolC family protein [Lentisphaeria bacterium]
MISLLTAAGCSNLDPWSEMHKAPIAPGKVSSARPASQPATPRPSGLAGQKLTLAQGIVLALENNPQTASSWQAARAAAARIGQAKSGYLPTVGLTSSAARGNPAELDAKTDEGIQNTFDAGFGVRWLLFDGGGRKARVQGAAAELLAANFRHNAVLQDVALGVEEDYYDLLAAQSLREVAIETVKQRDYHVQIAEARHRTGLVAKSDVLKAQTEKADADLGQVQAENALHLAKGRLASAMGLRVSEPFEIAGVPDDNPGEELADVESLLDEAARNRPELQVALAQIEVQRAGVKRAEARFWPALSLDTGVGWLGRTFFPGQGQWNIGAAVDAPLFTGFDRTYQLHLAKADLARAVADRRGVLQGVELEVWTAYWQIIESSQAIAAASRFVASAEESARVAEGEYKNGTGSIIELIDAQTAFSTARTRLIQARLGRHTALAQFERAVGRTLAATQVIDQKEVKP